MIGISLPIIYKSGSGYKEITTSLLTRFTWLKSPNCKCKYFLISILGFGISYSHICQKENYNVSDSVDPNTKQKLEDLQKFLDKLNETDNSDDKNKQ